MDFAFLKSNPLYVCIAFLVFYFVVAQPFLKLDLTKSLIFFAVLYILYKKFGNGFIEKKFSSGFGKRRRH